jgi:hypothetical protein
MTLIGYWPLNEDSGNTAYDASGNGNNGSLSGSINQGTPGTLGTTAYSFDGSDDAVTVTDSPELNLTDSLTISMWINPNNLSAQRENPIHKAYGGEFSLVLEDTAGTMNTYFGSAGENSSPYANNRWTDVASDNTWTHLCWVRDNDAQEVRLYKNGTNWSKNKTNTEWETTSASNNDMQIGSGYTNTFDGSISEVRLYNRALTPSEIQYLYEVSQRGRYVSSKKKIQNIIDLAVNSPVSGQVVSGTTSIDIEASSSAGSISSIEAEVNSNNISTASSSPASFSWDTTTATGGSNVLKAIASDDSNNSRTEDIPVIVDNTPPSVSFSNPSDGEVVTDTITVSGNSSDGESSVESMELQIDGSIIANSSDNTLSYSLDTNNYSNENHTLYLEAADRAGNKSSSNITIEIDNATVEDFESGSISSYGGDTGDFTVQTGTVYEGTYALEYTGGATGNRKVITDTNHTLSQGDSFECRVRLENMKDRSGLVFGAEAEEGTNDFSGYVVGAESAGSGHDQSIVRYDNGSRNVLRNVTFSNTVPSGEFLHYIVDWATDGTITFELRDSSGNTIDTITATDNNYTSGGIGWIANPNNSGDSIMYADILKTR